MQAHAKIQSGPQNKIRAQNITRRIHERQERQRLMQRH